MVVSVSKNLDSAFPSKNHFQAKINPASVFNKSFNLEKVFFLSLEEMATKEANNGNTMGKII